jgi:NitT/TauT family transport system ATP-binding protein
MTAITVDIRTKEFPPVGQAPAHTALKDVRFDVAGHEFVCLLGPSGCGKTTLLNIIAGLDTAFEGHVSLGGPESGAEPAIGYVFQTPRLLPWRTVIENIRLVLPKRDPETERRVDELLAFTGLEPFRHAFPERLSVGLARRVALVRAFAIRPDILLMDEPFVSLDEPTAQRLRDLLLEVWQSRPTTLLFVTHNTREAIDLADRLILLSPAPGTVLADIPLRMPRSERRDPSFVEAMRRKLLQQAPAIEV